MSERVKSAAEMALDAIAEACGCAEWEYPDQVVRDVLMVVRERDAAMERVVNLEARLAREENSHGLTIDQRDRASDAADALAYAIGTVEDIGEHSNLNDPWANALELLDSRLAQERAAGQQESAARMATLEALLDDGISLVMDFAPGHEVWLSAAAAALADVGEDGGGRD